MNFPFLGPFGEYYFIRFEFWFNVGSRDIFCLRCHSYLQITYYIWSVLLTLKVSRVANINFLLTTSTDHQE